MRANQKILITAVVVLSTSFLLLTLPIGQAGGEWSLAFYGDPTCGTCNNVENMVKDYVTTHPEIEVKYNHIDYYNITDDTEKQNYWSYMAQFGLDHPGVPAVVLNHSGTIQVLLDPNITPASLDAWLAGTLNAATIDFWVVFVSGLVVGGSPCILLILSVLGANLVAVEERKKYLSVSLGLILGVITAYIAVSVIFLAVVGFVGVLAYFKYIFASILIFIGIWQIVEFKKEKSTIFGTPNRIKEWLKSFIEKRSGTYAFLLGLLFTFVKIPCFGGVYLYIIYSVRQNPLFIFYVLTYFAGMVLPIIIILVALRAGFQSARINAFREKYRPYLRLASGIVLIAMTLYLLFLPS